MQRRGARPAVPLPRGDVRKVLVVAQRLALLGLVLDAEVAAAALLAVAGVAHEQLAELEEVGDAAGLLERLVEALVLAEHAHVGPELLAQRGDLAERLVEALGAAGHAAVVPHDLAELAVEVVDRLRALDRQQPVHLLGDGRLGLPEHRVVGGDGVGAEQRREVVADRGRQHEVAVGESLHERARAEPVRTVVREVRLAEHVQAREVAHQVVVNPEPAHRVVDGRVDPHGDLVRVLTGDALVHLEEVVVALLDDVLAEPRGSRRRSRGTRRS